MLIDFHSHAFADKIVEKAMQRLLSVAKIPNYSDGTISGLDNCLDKYGVDISVMLPVATKPTQQTIINDWAKEVQDKYSRIYSFGSVHPFADDVMEELERIKALGLHGIKLHPDYQDFFIDDERVFPVYRKCAELSLPVIFHAGWDPLSPDVVHAIPEASLKAHKAVPEMTMILAHGGGMNHWDDVEKHLVGEDIYFDTAMLCDYIEPEQLERIIKNHGADRILFGTDIPWHPADKERSLIQSLGISDDEKELIFHKNAERLLGI